MSTHQIPTAPPRSTSQRQQALDIANRIRSERSRLKRDLRDGHTAIVPLLLNPPACVQNARVFEVLLAAPKYGPAKAKRILALARISPVKKVSGLTARQRTELVTIIGGRLPVEQASA